jgi:heme exporter protein A
MPTLTADAVGQRFGSLLLFRRLSFTLRGGQTLAITGANGSGKSTLLRILAGVLRPKAGTVMLRRNGEAISTEERPLYTGLVAPYLGVYEQLSAYENLAFLAETRRLPEAESRIPAILERVQLAGREHDRVGTYSSGMKQRVKYAAALLGEPPLLLLDEPSANLDAAGMDMVRDVMDRQQASERLLIVATNLPSEAALCDRQLRIEDHR